MSTYAALGRRIGAHASIYGAASVATIATSIASVAIFTRYLEPSSYGRLAILLVFSSFLTIGLNLGTLQGTFRVGFGATDDEAVGDEGAAPVESRTARKALGTGIVLTSGLGALVLLAAWGVGPTLARGLVGDAGLTDAVLWATAGGALGAVWRLVVNLLRLQRRPVAYLVVHSARPVLGLALGVILLRAGWGLSGVLAGHAGGTAASVALGLLLNARAVAFSFSFSTVKALLRAGSPLVPVVIGFWLIETGDVFVLSRLVSDADVGIYRVASRIASVAAYVASALMMAWGPLSRSPLHGAAEQEHGRPAVMKRITTVFAGLLLWTIVAMAAVAHVLIRVAPPEYSAGAALVPLLAAGWVAKALMQMAYRVATFRTKQRVFALTAVLAGASFLVAGVLLGRLFGAYGVAGAGVGAFALGAVVLLVAAQRNEQRIGLDVPRIVAAGVVAAVASTALVELHLSGRRDTVAAAGVFVGYGGVLALLGMLPIPGRRATASPTVADEPQSDRELVLSLLRGELRSIDAARSRAVPEEEIRRLVGHFVAHYAGIDMRRSDPAALGSYILWRGSDEGRSFFAELLAAIGIDRSDLDRVGKLVLALRRER